MELSREFDYLRPFEADLVRVGPQGDCGYVLPSSVAEKTSGIYSVGISTDWQFEVEMSTKNPRMKIRAFDRTSGWMVFAYVALRDLLKGDPSELEKMSLKARMKSAAKYLKLSLQFRMFFIGKRRFSRRWVRLTSTNNSEIAFQDSIQDLFDSHDVLVKIDIEGGEYEIANPLIECLNKNSERINCVVMEFHDTNSRRVEFEAFVKSVSTLFPIVHLHGNNCVAVANDGLPEVLEITFARDCLNRFSSNLRFPVAGLDYPNDKSLPDITFSFVAAN